MRRIVLYGLNLSILFLLITVLNYWVGNYYHKYILTKSDEDMYGVYSQGICQDDHYASSITNELLTNSDVGENETLGYIYFPTIGEDIKGIINQGNLNDGQLGAMRYGVAHDPTTSMPGENGNVVIAGHREALFKNLEYLQTGDLIVLNINNNIFLYEVDSIEIVDPVNDKEQALEEIFGDEDIEELTLYTCYPFEPWRAFPYRYVVHAKPVDTSDLACSGGIYD